MLDLQKKTKFEDHLKGLDVSHIHRRILFGEKGNALFEDAVSIVFRGQGEAQALTQEEIMELKKRWDEALKEVPKKKQQWQNIAETIALSLIILLVGITSTLMGAVLGGMVGAGWGLIIAGPAGLWGGVIGGAVVGALLGVAFASAQIRPSPAPSVNPKKAEDKAQQTSDASVKPNPTVAPQSTVLSQPQSTAEERPMQTQQQELGVQSQSSIQNKARV